MDLWKKNILEPDICFEAMIGPLTVWVKKIGDEIHIAERREPESLSNSKGKSYYEIAEQEPKGLKWARYISQRESVELSFMPIMPDRAVVVRPESMLKLPPGRKAQFYVRVPIFVQIRSSCDGKDTALCEIPTVELSNIWFGDPVAGQLCHSLRTKARRDFIDFTPMPHRVICPVFISNKSDEMIDLQRICVQSQFLNIYGTDSLMWTNDIKLEFQTKDNLGVISYSDKPPALQPDARLISKARTADKKNIIRRSFDSFKTMGGF